jgi:hypothetical protein
MKIKCAVLSAIGALVIMGALIGIVLLAATYKIAAIVLVSVLGLMLFWSGLVVEGLCCGLVVRWLAN